MAVREKDFLRAMKDADPIFYRKALALAEQSAQNCEIRGEIMKRTVKAVLTGAAAIAAAVLLIVQIRLFTEQPVRPAAPPESSASVTDISAEETTVTTQETVITSTTQPAPAKEPIALGDGLYQVFGDIKTDGDAKTHCQYGTLWYDKEQGVTSAAAYGKTLDFSSVPFDRDQTQIVYCVPEDQSAVYFLRYRDFYRSDIDLQSPELLFHIPDEMTCWIYSLLSFPNTNLLFFDGSLNNGSRCIGTIDPDKKDIQYIACDAHEVYPCNTGAMVCDREAMFKHRQSIAYYWECGEIYQIALGNSKESEWPPFISANGKYIFTLMEGKTKAGKRIDRYTVYDTKSGQMIKTLDKVFDNDYSNRRTDIIGFNEQAQCVYFQIHSYSTFEFYRLDFGE